LVLGGIPFGIFGTENIPHPVVDSASGESLTTSGGDDLSVTVESIVGSSGGSESVFGGSDGVTDSIVAGGKDSTHCISGLGVPTEVVGLILSGVGSGASLDVGGGAGDLVA
jgi:hypothetical protein